LYQGRQRGQLPLLFCSARQAMIGGGEVPPSLRCL